jgi:hypothetical protein
VAAVRYTFTYKKYTKQHDEAEYTKQNIYMTSRIKLLGIAWHVVRDFAINGFRKMAYRGLTQM